MRNRRYGEKANCVICGDEYIIKSTHHYSTTPYCEKETCYKTYIRRRAQEGIEGRCTQCGRLRKDCGHSVSTSSS